jgi:hypothetical protein
MSEVTRVLAEKLAMALEAKFKRSKATKDNQVWLCTICHKPVPVEGGFKYPYTHGIRFSHENKTYRCFIEEEKPPKSKQG